MQLHANEHASRSSGITEGGGGREVGRKKNGEEKGSKTLEGKERESIIYHDIEGL